MTRARPFPRFAIAVALASLLSHCDRTPSSPPSSPGPSTSTAPPALVDAPAPDAPGEPDASTAETPTPIAGATPPAPPDPGYEGDAPTAVTRSEYTITLPDEHSTIPVERALRIDDDGERAAAIFRGEGLPVVPGLRVTARAGWLGFVLSSASGSRYRTVSPDELQRYLLGGPPPRPAGVPSFRRTGRTLLASRGGLSATLEFDAQGPTRPLPCRLLVALLLGGDITAARAACSDALPLRRVTLRAQGYPSLAIERATTATVQLPRAQLAVPPDGAPSDLPLPSRPPSTLLVTAEQLRTLPGVREPRHTLTVVNLLPREVLVFVDDIALGWLSAGDTARYEGFASEEHPVRFRTFDGGLRTPVVDRIFPSTIRPGIGPQGNVVPHLMPSREEPRR